jgi:hypothetical protein
MVEQNDLYYHELDGKYSGTYKAQIDGGSL